MRRCTTPTFTLRLKTKAGQPYVIPTLSDLRVTFKQDGKAKVDKKLSDCSISENVITVTLTQQDTLKFEEGKAVKVQVKGKDSVTGKIIPTKVKTVPCEEILNEEVL